MTDQTASEALTRDEETLARWAERRSSGDVHAGEVELLAIAERLRDALADADQLRAHLGALLVAEEQRCQLAINDSPTDPHLNGRLVGLQRARDIVTGPAPEPTRAPAQESAGASGTPQGHTDTGTHISGPQGCSQAVPQTASEHIEQIRTSLAAALDRAHNEGERSR